MRLAFGVDIGGTNTRLALVDESGNILELKSFRTDPESHEAVLERLAREILELKGSVCGSIVGVGVGCAGVIRFESGTLLFSPNLPGWKNVAISERLRDLVGFCVFVDNDANMFTLAEAKLGAGRGKKHIIGLTLGTGVGGGIFVDGKLIRGSWGGGAELGHIIIDPEGPGCNCGARGCIEAYVGAYAIERRARELFLSNARAVPKNLTPEYIGKLANEADRVACEIIASTAYYLAIGVASIINIFNPEMVVIGGGISNLGPLLFDPLRRLALKKALPHLAESVTIEKSVLGPTAGVLGAAFTCFAS